MFWPEGTRNYSKILKCPVSQILWHQKAFLSWTISVTSDCAPLYLIHRRIYLSAFREILLVVYKIQASLVKCSFPGTEIEIGVRVMKGEGAGSGTRAERQTENILHVEFHIRHRKNAVLQRSEGPADGHREEKTFSTGKPILLVDAFTQLIPSYSRTETRSYKNVSRLQNEDRRGWSNWRDIEAKGQIFPLAKN